MRDCDRVLPRALVRWLCLVPVCALFVPWGAAQTSTKAAVLASKHNLSVSGSGSTGRDVCFYCHTPHSSYPEVKPLWNSTLSSQTYNIFVLDTPGAGPETPSAGSSKLCLSCHDGTVAPGQTVAAGTIPTGRSMGPGTVLGTNLTDDHPVGFQPADDGELASSLFLTPPTSLDPAVRLPAGRVECTSCHDPHREDIDPIARKFLVRSNSGGAICLACHDPGRAHPNRLAGWLTGAHSTFSNTVTVTSSSPPYGTVSSDACGNCHLLHGGKGTEAFRLVRAPEEETCAICHAGTGVSPTLRDILGEFNKTYSHPTLTVSGQHKPNESIAPVNSARHAECSDCHNPHAAAASSGTTIPPGVPAPLTGASGYDGSVALYPAENEYQVCYKCHADSVNKPQNTPGYSRYGRTPIRQTDSQTADPNNLRLKFASAVSRHNVSSPRWRTNAEVPSLRPFMLNLDGSTGRSLGPGTYIYCTDCHANNQARKSHGTGPNGPHGSIWPHILERRYDLEPLPATPGGVSPGVPYQPGINGSYAMCNKCHDIANSILQNRSFRRHSKHILEEGASCSTCHDPHGIQGGNSTNNPSLINFDISIVGPSPRTGTVRFSKMGRMDRCYLTCHGRSHG